MQVASACVQATPRLSNKSLEAHADRTQFQSICHDISAHPPIPHIQAISCNAMPCHVATSSISERKRRQLKYRGNTLQCSVHFKVLHMHSSHHTLCISILVLFQLHCQDTCMDPLSCLGFASLPCMRSRPHLTLLQPCHHSISTVLVLCPEVCLRANTDDTPFKKHLNVHQWLSV